MTVVDVGRDTRVYRWFMLASCQATYGCPQLLGVCFTVDTVKLSLAAAGYVATYLRRGRLASVDFSASALP